MATKEEIDAHLKAARGGYTQEQLQTAFDLVKDAAHWKNPIETIIDRDQMDVVDKAVPWFTGTVASFEETDDRTKVRVTADGYYLGPCN